MNLFPPPRAENTKKTTLLSNYRCLFFKKKWNLPPDPAGGEATATALRRWEGIGECPPPPPDLMGMEESAAACGGGRGGGGSGRRSPIHHIRREGRRRQWPAVAGGEAAVAGGTLPSARSCGRGGDGGDRLPTPRRRRWCPPQRRTFFMFLVFLVFLNDLGLVGVFLDVIGLVRVKGSCFEPMHRAYFFFFWFVEPQRCRF